MRIRTVKLLFFSVASAAVITSCSHTGGSFETDSKTGVTYRFLKHDESGVKGTDSSYARVVLAYYGKGKDGKDSLIFDSHKKSGDSTGNITIFLKKTFNGSLEQGILMMSPGDSAEFQINADSLYTKTFHFPADKLPPGVTASTVYDFHIKLTSFMTKKDMMAEQMKQRQKYMEKIMQRKSVEVSSIADYLKKNHYENVKPDKDSIFLLEPGKGKGKQIKNGDSIEVKYQGTLLDGSVFDPGNQNLKILYSPGASLIPGWIKILGTLHEGEKVKVLIPSAMAYGSRQASQLILPFTPLVFDMQVVRVKSN